MRLLLVCVTGLLACHDGARTRPRVEPATTAPKQAHGAGRDRWRGGGVYVDGRPVGVLRFAELPPAIAPIWETQRQRLAFRPGEPVRYHESQVRRYRVTDYLAAIGVRLDEVVQVHLHGGRDNAIVLTRDDLRRHADDILFKFAGDTFGKPIPVLRGIPAGTSFDNLSAMTIYVKRAPPTLTADHTLELDGRPVRGIPYHGEPIRNGVRVYVDDRLAAVLKRNQLATTDDASLRLSEALAREGVTTTAVERAQLIWNEERAAAVAFTDLTFRFGQSGEITVGDGKPVEAIALYTR